MTTRDIPIPARMRNLPRNKADYVVPWFVAFIDGERDFRVIREDGIGIAYNERLCWLCGQTRGKYGAFVIGSMCAVNRVSAEPPSHLECARYAATVCPFLTTPKMIRRERGIDHQNVSGQMITRNPGVTLVWVSTTWRPFPVENGVLFDVGDPTNTEWYAEGRTATRAEILASIDSGLPLLEAECASDDDRRVLAQMHAQALQVVPA